MSVDEILRGQAGVVSRAQALTAGLSSAAVSLRLSRGRWRALYPGVYLAADRRLTDEARLRAAVLWAGPDATASGVAAAWWHRLWPALSNDVEVTVPRGQNPRSRRGVRIRRRDLHDWDRVERRGVAVTAVPLTVLEASVALGRRGQEFLDRALQRGSVRFATLVTAHNRNLGRRGSAAAARLLAAAADRAASQAERTLIALLRAAGLTGWQAGYRVGDYALDVAFAARRIAIEVDGWAWHSDAHRFGHDRRRQNALVLAGWTVLRFTWHDLTNRPAAVIADIRSALSRAA